ncbi:MAG: energy transducer TonB [Edaphobacter sp.]
MSIAAMFTLTGELYAQDTTALVERLHRATLLNSIDDATMKPWHLKLSFQLFDAKGKPTETGTIEEWWAGPTMHKTVYTSPSYTSTEIQTKDGFYRSRGVASVPSLLELVLQQVVDPMPSERDIVDSKPDLRKEDAGKARMDCIMLSQPIRNVAYAPFGLFPTYCLDRDKDSLRVSYDFGSELRVRNRLGTFQQRIVAVDQTTLQNSITEITAHVEALQTTPLNEGALVPTTDLIEVKPNQVLVASRVMAGLKISGVAPSYPETSKRNHTSGPVILKARIGTDGRIHSLQVISTPDADLAIASLAAVRQWIYKPYLLNGEPVEIDTQITVNFNFGFR